MSKQRPGRFAALAAGATAAGTARLAYSALNRRPPGGVKTWSRTNHRGEPVTLLEGPAVAVGAVAGVLVQAGVRAVGSGQSRAARRGSSYRAESAMIVAAVTNATPGKLVKIRYASWNDSR